MKRSIIILFLLACTVVAFAQKNPPQAKNRYGIALKEVNGAWEAAKPSAGGRFNNRTDTIPGFLVPYTPSRFMKEYGANVVSKEYVYKTIPGSGDKLKLYIDSPKGQGAGPFPCLLFIHGGAWTNGSPDEAKLVHLGAYMASQGIAVARMAYSKNPQFNIDNTLSDLDDVIAYIRQHAKEMNIDPNRMGVSGSSAGGHLSSYLAMTRPGIKALISLCGPHNLVKQFEYMGEGGNRLLAYFKAEGGNTASLEKYSPIYNIPETEKIPAILLIHGEWDTSVSFTQSVEMKAALESKGAKVQFYPVKYAGHAIFDEELGDYENVVRLIATFAKEHL